MIEVGMKLNHLKEALKVANEKLALAEEKRQVAN